VWVRIGNQIATDAFVDGSTHTTTVQGLTNGTQYSVTVAALNAEGLGPESSPPVTVVPSCSSTTLTYDGDEYVMAGGTFNVGALLASPDSSCVGGQPVTFSLDTNPITLAAGTFQLATSTTNSSGQTPLVPVSTAGWQEGVYTLTASYAGTLTCAPAQDIVALTVASASDAASGGGWISDNGRTSFGFTVRLVPHTTSTYKGQFQLINNGKWRLKGTLSSYSTSLGVGTASGTGDLYYQAATGGWQLAQQGVSFTIQFTASSGGKKASPGTLGIQISYTPTSPPQPAHLPNTAPVPLKGGHIGMH
jgi:hypothetical protein